MKYQYANSFIKDSQGLPESVRSHIGKLIQDIQAANHFQEIQHVKKMKGASNAYRIRIGDYRVGIFLLEGEVVFTRVLHRREIYRYFP
jgi:mRNA interferase RelE/StbE